MARISKFWGGIVKHCGDAGGLRGSERLWRAFLIRAEIKQGCFNSGRTKSLQGRSDTNDRRRNHNYSSFIIHHSLFIKTKAFKGAGQWE